MRKLAWLMVALGVVCLAASTLYAGGIINKQNQSADYIRTLNRHAATDYADAAVYNPAGVMKFDDGLKIKADVMYFNKDYSNTVPATFPAPPPFGLAGGEGDYSSTQPSIIPGFFATYKKNRWAGYFAFTIPAGGGELDYKNGDARTVLLANGVAAGAPPGSFDTIESMNLEVKQSSVFGYTLGGSFKINKMWSVSAGVRYATGTREFDGSATISGVAPDLTANLNLEQEASGFAGILGVNFSALEDKLNIAATYISNTKMEYENKVKSDFPPGLAASIGFADGSKTRIDIPALLGFGASYQVLPKLKLDLNYVYYFEKNAEIDTFDGEGDSWDLGLSAEYRFNPMWMASIGYLHTDIKLDADEQINEPEEPKLDANTLGLGFVVNPIPRLALTFSGLKVFYSSVTDSSGITYDKDVWSLGAGIQYSFF